MWLSRGRAGSVLLAMVLLSASMVLAVPAAVAADAEDAQDTVERATVAFKGFLRDPNYKWMVDHLKDAKGVLIYPQVLKAGFFLGGSGGTGVLLGREGKTDDWSYPAFYTMGSVSFGLQFGGESAEVVLLVMSQKGMDSLLASKFKLGGRPPSRWARWGPGRNRTSRPISSPSPVEGAVCRREPGRVVPRGPRQPEPRVLRKGGQAERYSHKASAANPKADPLREELKKAK
jgi:hypothetical protein